MTVSRRDALKLLFVCSAASATHVAATTAVYSAEERWSAVMRKYITATYYYDHARALLHGPAASFKYQSWIAFDAKAGLCIQHAAGDEVRGAVIIEKDKYHQRSVTHGWKSLPSFSAAINAIRGMTGLSAGTGYCIASLLLALRSEEPLGLAGLSEVACAPDAKNCGTLVGVMGEHRMALKLTDGTDQIREIGREAEGYKSVARIDSRFDTPFDWNSVVDAMRRNPDKLAIPRVS